MRLSDIRTIGVVGAGAMGHGVALSFALYDYPTILHDVSKDNLQIAMQKIKSALDKFEEEGVVQSRQVKATIERIIPTTEFSVLAREADFVSESIVENCADKKDLFKKLDAACPPETILASNTSSLVLSDFASGVRRQDKTLITPYFNPPYIIPCVEVVKGQGTSDETFDLTYQLLEKVNKVPVRVLKELPGYLVNRIQFALWREVFDLWDRGVASTEDIDLAVKASFGFRLGAIGPLMTLDLSGVMKWGQANYEMFAGMYKEICDDNEVPEKIKNLMLSGQTFYNFSSEKWGDLMRRRDKEFLQRLVRRDWIKLK